MTVLASSRALLAGTGEISSAKKKIIDGRVLIEYLTRNNEKPPAVPSREGIDRQAGVPLISAELL